MRAAGGGGAGVWTATSNGQYGQWWFDAAPSRHRTASAATRRDHAHPPSRDHAHLAPRDPPPPPTCQVPGGGSSWRLPPRAASSTPGRLTYSTSVSGPDLGRQVSTPGSDGVSAGDAPAAALLRDYERYRRLQVSARQYVHTAAKNNV